MKNLILRILILLISIAVILGCITYYVNTVVLHRALQETIQFSSQGTFRLLNDFLAPYPLNQWQDILEKYQPPGTKKITILPIKELKVDKKQMNAIKNNEYLYIQSEKNLYEIIPLYHRVNHSDYVYKTDLSPSYEFWVQYIWGWSIKMILSTLDSLPKSAWPEYLKKVSLMHETSITVINMSDKSLEPSEKNRLSHHQMVTSGAKESEITFYIPMKENNLALKFGPVHVPFFTIYSQYILFIAALIFLAIMVLVLAFLFAFTLEKLKKLARDYGNSQFDSPIKIRKISSLYPLYNNLKNMAQRIKTLIHSHKELTHSVSHELRTPISRLRFSLELMKEASDPTEIANQITSMEGDIAELEDLVSEMLTYAQLDRVEIKYDIQKIPLLSMTNTAISKIKSNKKIIHEVNDIVVHANEKYVLRALQNLIQNAVKHAKSTIRLSSNHSQLIIEDDGPGILVEDRENIFNPFVQLPNQPRDQAKGFGLGLAITKKIIDQHQWKIFVEDSDLGGAKMIVLFFPSFSHHVFL